MSCAEHPCVCVCVCVCDDLYTPLPFLFYSCFITMVCSLLSCAYNRHTQTRCNAHARNIASLLHAFSAQITFCGINTDRPSANSEKFASEYIAVYIISVYS